MATYGVLCLVFALGAWACGGTGSGPAGDVSNFAGAAWTGTATATTTCGAASSMSSVPFDVTFLQSKQAGDVYYVSGSSGNPDCVFDFAVSGDSAMLTHASVTCASGSRYTSYDLTSDGHRLTGELVGTVVQGGQSCGEVVDVAATR